MPKMREPLSDAEISNQLGGLVWEAFQAFMVDSRYVLDMVENANSIDATRKAWAAREAEPLLSPEERAERKAAILAALAEGVTYSAAAKQFGISPKTVAKYRTDQLAERADAEA